MKITIYKPAVSMDSAKNMLHDAFFRLASESILPLPDVREFVSIFPPCKTPQKFDMELCATVQREGKNMLFSGYVLCREENAKCLEISYMLSSPR